MPEWREQRRDNSRLSDDRDADGERPGEFDEREGNESSPRGYGRLLLLTLLAVVLCAVVANLLGKGEGSDRGFFSFSSETTGNTDSRTGTTVQAGGDAFQRRGSDEAVSRDYAYTADKGEITIVKYTGSGGSVVIPDFIDGLPVTTIARSAFFGCDKIVSIKVPDSITSIGDSAFAESGITAFSIPKGVATVEDFTFCGCLYLANVTIPDTVTNIGSKAFANCRSLKSINIPDSVMGIDDTTAGHSFDDTTMVSKGR